jgi:hypothetical protein
MGNDMPSRLALVMASGRIRMTIYMFVAMASSLATVIRQVSSLDLETARNRSFVVSLPEAANSCEVRQRQTGVRRAAVSGSAYLVSSKEVSVETEVSEGNQVDAMQEEKEIDTTDRQMDRDTRSHI